VNLNSRVFAVMKKEFIHILNDKMTLMIVIMLPILQLIIFGYALNMEIQHIDMQVIDYDRTISSNSLIDEFSHSSYFHVESNTSFISNIERYLYSGKAKAILIIPKDFSEMLKRDSQISVQLLIDASDPNSANLIKIYCQAVLSKYNIKHGNIYTMPFTVSHSVWYNPDLKSSYFFVPGILAMLLVMISALLTSIAITREKELGTMEQILVSPIRSWEIIIGKVVPYILLAFIDACLVLLVGMLLFHIPFQGSVLDCTILTLLYIITALSLGILISTIAQTQQTALMFALAITLLPTIMLSGFIFPIRSMPLLLQAVSYIVPAKYYLMIIRGIMIKGNSLSELYVQAIFLLVMSVGMLSIAWKRFKTHV